MRKVLTLNQIAIEGLERFPRARYEVGSEVVDPDAILVRSHPLSEADISPRLRAVARAGAGVNNIPVPEYTERGIVVFNTPGANANSVKELVFASMLLASRNVLAGTRFVESLRDVNDPDELNRRVEAEKKTYRGGELAGKALGVVGLGAIGSLVAEAGLRLGMNVVGYDPALSVDAAWRLPAEVQKADNLHTLFARADYVTLHVPATPDTENLVNEDSLKSFRQGAMLLNFARDEVVDPRAIRGALDSGRLARYASDFPAPDLIGRPDVILTPHLGASTAEAERNCAVMASDQIIEFLENGNIINSVNFPAVFLERTEGERISVTNRNVPRMLGHILSILAEHDINVIDMLNKSREDVAYNLIDLAAPPTEAVLDQIRAIEGVINVRSIDV